MIPVPVGSFVGLVLCSGLDFLLNFQELYLVPSAGVETLLTPIVCPVREAIRWGSTAAVSPVDFARPFPFPERACLVLSPRGGPSLLRHKAWFSCSPLHTAVSLLS